MRTLLTLSTALTLLAAPAFAQDSTRTIVIEPVAPSFDELVSAPIQYDENGVVQAQHFNADDLTDEQYQALLREADRVRAYQAANGVDYTTSVNTAPTTVYNPPVTTYTAPTYIEPTYIAPSYDLELYAPEAPVTTTTNVQHVVVKGDNLYRLAKRYDTTVTAIQSANNMSGTALSLGQAITIPGKVIESSYTAVSQPIYVSAPVREGNVTRRIVEPTPISASTNSVYAVLPKDTLFAISRRVCVGVDALSSLNGITDPSTLQPGQRLRLPQGHCLSQ